MQMERFMLGGLLLALLSVCRAAPVLQGYDVVEYFNLEKEGKELGVLGVHIWACRLLTFDKSKKEKRPLGLYEFWFSSPENVALFEADPWKYAPKYGGFGATEIAEETLGYPWTKNFLGPPGSPWDAWTVHKDSLYISSWRTDTFADDIDGTIALADTRWSQWFGNLNAGPFNTQCQSNVCRSIPQHRLDLSSLPPDTPEVQCTTNGFLHSLSRIVDRVGSTQQELYQLQDEDYFSPTRESRPTLLGGSSAGGSGPSLTEESDRESEGGRLLGTILGSSTSQSRGKARGKKDSEEYLAISKPALIGEEFSALRKPIDRNSFVAPALLGYDPVAYFGINGADEGLVGTPKYACHLATYDESRKKKSLLGVYEFWFRSASNMKKFQRDPWKYVPQFGGFCSWGIATEWKEQGWPWDKDFLGPPGQPWNAWTVYEGDLYFNYWPSIGGSFFATPETNIKRGSERWKTWWGSLAAGPINTHCPNAGCVNHAQDLSPPCPLDAKCRGDVPKVACLTRKTV